MLTLKEMLADKANFQDALVINVAGNTMTFGQLRALDTESRQAVEKLDKELQTRKAALEAEQAAFKTSQAHTADLYVTLTQAVEAVKAGRMNDPAIAKLFAGANPPANLTPANDPFAALSRYEQDAMLGPFVGVIKALREQVATGQNVAAQLTEANKKMAASYINGVLEDRYDRIVPNGKQEQYPLGDLIQRAVKAQQFSSDGTPNIKWAFKEASSGETAQAKEAEIRADERKKIEKEMAERAAGGSGKPGEVFIPTPTSFGLDVHNRSGNAPKPFASLDEAFAAAAKDSAIWNPEAQA